MPPFPSHQAHPAILSSLISIDGHAHFPSRAAAPSPAPPAPDPISQSLLAASRSPTTWSKWAACTCAGGPSHWPHHAGPLSWTDDGLSFPPSFRSLALSLPPATCARPSRFKLHHQSLLVWSGKNSQPIEAASSAWDGWSCLSTGQLDSSEDNASMQEANSITPSPAHDWQPPPPLLRAGVPRAETSGCAVNGWYSLDDQRPLAGTRVLLITKEQDQPDQPDQPG